MGWLLCCSFSRYWVGWKFRYSCKRNMENIMIHILISIDLANLTAVPLSNNSSTIAKLNSNAVPGDLDVIIFPDTTTESSWN